MIYCVVPAPLEGELFDRLTAYYAGDPNVQVIVDRRSSERRSAEQRLADDRQREQRDRRRQRITGEFPPLEQPG
ncbi:MAG: hypothetical protein NVSMB51_05540 [Solirubrobacteraceae bacterium]